MFQIQEDQIRQTATQLIQTLPADAGAEVIERLRYRLDGMNWLVSCAGFSGSEISKWLLEQDRALFRRWQRSLWNSCCDGTNSTTRIDG